MNHYFTGRVDTGYKRAGAAAVARAAARSGDSLRAVDAYRELLIEAPNDSTALSVSREVIEIYQNRTLEPEKAQGARMALVDKFTPGFSWTGANPNLSKEARDARESALRESAQYELAKAEGVAGSDATRTRRSRAASAFGSGPATGVALAATRQHFAEAARLYAKYMADYGASDSARAVDNLYAEALFGDGQYARAGAEYARTAYLFPADTSKAVTASEQRAAQNAIVAYDSALSAHKTDRSLQDSLFSVISAYAEHYPRTEVAKRALIEEGRRASESGRWDVMASAFRQYAGQYPQDAYTPTAMKLVGDATSPARQRPRHNGIFGVRERRPQRGHQAQEFREAHSGRRRVDVRRLARPGRAVSAGGARCDCRLCRCESVERKGGRRSARRHRDLHARGQHRAWAQRRGVLSKDAWPTPRSSPSG